MGLFACSKSPHGQGAWLRPPAAAALLALLALVMASCSSPRDHLPAVRDLYQKAAARHLRNPVIVVHGILGSRLQERESGRTVWGAFTSDATDPNTPSGARALALPFEDVALGATPDLKAALVAATGPLKAIQINLLFAVVNVGVYARILKTLGVGGYTDPVLVDPDSPSYAADHYTCFTFFYDWRRDNSENAVAFGEFVTSLRKRVDGAANLRIAELRGQADAAALAEADALEAWLSNGYRFDVVAHSMGGLVLRYFLRYGATPLPSDGSVPQVTWAGAEQIDRLVLVGTPSLGSMEALQNLTQGFDPGGILLPHFEAALLGTMPSIYQLLPRGQGLVVDDKGRSLDVDIFDVDVWDRNNWGLLADDADTYLRWLLPDVADRAERRRKARDVVAANLERAKRFHRAIDFAAPSSPTELRLFAADTESTLAKVRLEERDGRLVPCFTGDELRTFGDGTVTRRSALGDLRASEMAGTWLDSTVEWGGVTFLPDDHVGLTANPVFTDNLLFYLLEQAPRRR
ncbi:MAG: hypothetical protein AB8H80_24000 [Planctomycetota bacterium]